MTKPNKLQTFDITSLSEKILLGKVLVTFVYYIYLGFRKIEIINKMMLECPYFAVELFICPSFKTFSR